MTIENDGEGGTGDSASTRADAGPTVGTAVMICFFPAYPPEWGAGRVSCAVAENISLPCTLLQCGPQKTSDSDLSFRCEDGGDSDDWARVQVVGDCSDALLPRKLLRMLDVISSMSAEVRRLKPDVLILEGASWPAYHWAFLRDLSLRAGDWSPGGVVYHAHNVEHDLRQRRYGRLSSPVAGITSWFESLVLDEVDVATAVSPADARRFRELYGAHTRIVPNGVDVGRFTPDDKEADSVDVESGPVRNPRLIFSGSYQYPPNREAIDWLVQHMPAIRDRVPGTSLVVTGGEVPWERDFLHCPGHLPDAEYIRVLQSAHVAVVPLRRGSGTRLKILEAMAAGTPVLSTPKGAEGLNVEPGSDLLLSNLGDGFVDDVVRLLRSPELRSTLATSAARTVLDCYDWSIVAERMDKAIAEAQTIGSQLR